MFERFTQAARRALFFARYECSEHGSTTIELEHLLLGILREPGGVTDTVLARLDCTPETLRREIQHGWKPGERLPESTEIPFAPATKRALNEAAAEADGLGHSYIGTEHLVLGVLRQDATPAASILRAHGVQLNDVRDVAKSTDVRREGSGGPWSVTLSSQTVSGAIDTIKERVMHLAAAPDARTRQELAARILVALDALRPHL